MAIQRNIPSDFKINGADLCFDEVFRLICENIEVKIDDEDFVYFIDESYVMDTTKGGRWENFTPNYVEILDNGFKELLYDKTEISNDFAKSYNYTIESIILLVNRIIDALKLQNKNDNRIKLFADMLNKPALHFKEAIARMLFVNQLFWQTDHRLVGLGAWDMILIKYYNEDVKNGLLTRKEALEIIEKVYLILHKYYDYKSNVLQGDTGQIFVLGRSDENGEYICNELTYMFIEAMMDLKLPEPKCLLRVSKKTPRDLIELSLKSIATGIGAPLLANDDVIIPRLVEFGIEDSDAREYTTSACWEPLIGGKSTSPNNRTALNYLRAFDNMLRRENLNKIKSFDEFFETYLVYLRRNLRAVKRVVDKLVFQYDPLLSVFTYGCKSKKKDVSQGGAKYHNIGITSVAIGNLVNAMFIVRSLVFEKKEYTLIDIKKATLTEFEGYDKLYEYVKTNEKAYGTDDIEVIDLLNKITDCVAAEIEGFTNKLGGRFKFGLSGSAYIDAARGFGPSIDGRKSGEPFVVHISNENNNSFTGVINFAAKAKYDKSRFNGNVVDIMSSPDFINNNFDKVVDILIVGIKSGIFEMQMNVVSSDMLIEARKNPLKFPKLVVRVWGFSSYFNDLPDEYKDVLIERAMKNEGKIA